MKIGSIGYNYSHGADFVMDRPNGPGAWLFLLIKNSAIFELNGRTTKVKKDSFIIIIRLSAKGTNEVMKKCFR